MNRRFIQKSILCFNQDYRNRSLLASTWHLVSQTEDPTDLQAKRAFIIIPQDKMTTLMTEADISDSPSDSDSGGVSLYNKPGVTGTPGQSRTANQRLRRRKRRDASSKNTSNGLNVNGSDISPDEAGVNNIIGLEQEIKNLTIQTHESNTIDSDGTSIMANTEDPTRIEQELKNSTRQSREAYKPSATVSKTLSTSKHVGGWRPSTKKEPEIPPTTRVLRSQTRALQKMAANSNKSSTNNERDPANPILKLLPRPTPTTDYLNQACRPPQKLKNLRPLLIIVDLNGCLLDRGRNKGGSGKLRPYLEDLLGYCLNHHHVMVWSSATPQNVASMTEQVFFGHEKPPIAIWNRASLRLSPAQASQKVQVYKQLQWVWQDNKIAKSHPNAANGSRWDQTNTILLDDSLEKAAAQPHNQLLMPEYKKENDHLEKNFKILLKAMEYIAEAALHEDVSAFIHNLSFAEWMNGTTAASKAMAMAADSMSTNQA